MATLREIGGDCAARPSFAAFPDDIYNRGSMSAMRCRFLKWVAKKKYLKEAARMAARRWYSVMREALARMPARGRLKRRRVCEIAGLRPRAFVLCEPARNCALLRIAIFRCSK